MKYNIDEQERIIRNEFPASVCRVVAVLGANDRKILEMAVKRLTELGHEEYGDRSFHLTRKQLKQETLEELADAVVYQSIFSAKEKGRIE